MIDDMFVCCKVKVYVIMWMVVVEWLDGVWEIDNGEYRMVFISIEG